MTYRPETRVELGARRDIIKAVFALDAGECESVAMLLDPTDTWRQELLDSAEYLRGLEVHRHQRGPALVLTVIDERASSSGYRGHRDD